MHLLDVRIARAAGGAALVGGTSRSLRFRGSRGVTMAPGESVLSDPLGFRVRRFERLAVSLYVDPGSAGGPTRHYVGQQTSYLAAPAEGDRTAEESGQSFGEQTLSRFIVDRIDVKKPERAGAVVSFGDSLTDGLQDDGGGIDLDVRYPDFLAARLARSERMRQSSVLNAGISGNRITRGGVIPVFGLTAEDRLGADAIRQPGVSNVILLEGTNDLGPDRPVQPIISALRDLIKRLERPALGIETFLGTVPPNVDGSLSPANQERVNAKRSKLNRWIRHQDLSDHHVDFFRALRNPGDPSRLDPAFDSGDHLHPSTAGYRAMARAVPLGKLATGCSPR